MRGALPCHGGSAAEADHAHIARSYDGDTPWGGQFRGLLIIFDGEGEGWRGEKGVSCVQFDRGRDGGVDSGAELGEGEERRRGLW